MHAVVHRSNRFEKTNRFTYVIPALIWFGFMPFRLLIHWSDGCERAVASDVFEWRISFNFNVINFIRYDIRRWWFVAWAAINFTKAIIILTHSSFITFYEFWCIADAVVALWAQIDCWWTPLGLIHFIRIFLIFMTCFRFNHSLNSHLLHLLIALVCKFK